MDSKRKVIVTKERNVTTYAEMWHTSYCLLVKGQEELRMSVHQFRASLVFSAFTLEAYLNHIGAKIFSCWEDLERLSPKEKLNIIAERLNVEVHYEKRPWQIMKKLFQFRNDIAHGKSVKVKSKNILPLEKHSDDDFHELFERTRWEKYLSDDEYRAFQWYLMTYPDAGDIVRGTGGVRKIRWKQKGRGKRGGQ